MRAALSRRPVIYAVIASIGIVLIWRGIWYTADLFPFLNGPTSFMIGVIILLIIGVFVSSFIGSHIIIGGIRGEKKLTEMSKNEIEEAISTENRKIEGIKDSLSRIEDDIKNIKNNPR